MSKLFFHYAKNIGCVDSHGTPLWDSQKVRAEDWEIAKAFVKKVREGTPVYQKFFFSASERVQDVNSSKALDDLEEKILGEIITEGSYPKRVRFWRFVGLISRGVTPRDLA